MVASQRVVSFHIKEAKKHLTKGVLALIAGDFETGWKYYAKRAELCWWTTRFKDIPAWKGEDISGKRLLLCYEQALGEQIYFASVIPDLVAKGVQVVLEVDPRLVTLFARSFPDVEVIPYEFPWNEACYTVDFQAPIGDAFQYTIKSFDDFPKRDSYLVPDPEIVAKLEPYKGRIGLSWGSKAPIYAAKKTISIDLFKPLIDATPVISVQYGSEPSPIDCVPDFEITQDMENMAALLSVCKEVVSVSNATAHLSAAVGTRTYVMVPNGLGRQFYWYPERETVPGYPMASAYLNVPGGDWKLLVEYLTKKCLNVENKT